MSFHRGWVITVTASWLCATPSEPMAFPTEPPAVANISAQEVLDAVREASGGHAWDTIRQVDAHGTLSAAGLKGEITTSSSLIDDRSRQHVSLGPIERTEGHDGVLPWSRDASGLVDVFGSDQPPPESIAESFLTRHGYLRPLRDEHHASVRLERRAARAFQVVSLTPPGGRPLELWVDATTQLIAHVAFPSEQWTEDWSDYRRVERVLLPHRIVGNSAARNEQTIRIQSYRLRGDVDAQGFSRPVSHATDVTLRQPILIPAAIHSGHVAVRASINGSAPLPFVLDTGASINVLTPAAASLLGIAAEGQYNGSGIGEAAVPMSLAKVARLQVGEATMTNQRFAVVPLPSLNTTIEGKREPVAGLLGYDFFRRFVVGIDYDEQLVSLAPLQACAEKREKAARLYFDGSRLPQVEATLDGVPGLWILDVGNASASLVTQPMAARLRISAEAGTHYRRTGAGGALGVRAVRFETLAIGGQVLRAPVLEIAQQSRGALASSSLAGNLGYTHLKQLSPIFDYECRRLSVRAPHHASIDEGMPSARDQRH